jgi:DNA topoisomerase III
MAEAAATTRKIIDTIRAQAAATPAPAGMEPLAVACPNCGGQVAADHRNYQCGGCKFKIPRVLSSRKISPSEASRLMRDMALASLDGFVSSTSKKSFSAGLLINAEFEVKFDFGERAPAGPALSVACPICRSAIHDRGRQFECEKGDFKLWKNVAGRDLSPAEVTTLITEKSLPPIDGLKGSKGLFSAGLKLLKPDATGKAGVEFVFPNKR